MKPKPLSSLNHFTVTLILMIPYSVRYAGGLGVRYLRTTRTHLAVAAPGIKKTRAERAQVRFVTGLR